MRVLARWVRMPLMSSLRSCLRCSAASTAILMGTLSPVSAQSADVDALFAPGTIYSVGALAGVGPRFQGGGGAALWGLPYLSFRRADEAPEWWSPDDGLDVNLFSAGPFRLGPVLDLRDGRSAGDTHHVPGLPTVPLTVGLGLYGELWLAGDTLRLRAEVTQGLRAHDGVLVKLAADVVGRFGRFTLSGGPRLVLADSASQRVDFGVPDRAEGLAPFTPRGGLRSAGAAAAVAYDWSENWQTLVYGRYDRLLSDSAQNPIVRRFGSIHALSFGVGAIYSFRTLP